MSQRPGKKIGKLEVKLDRKKTRYKWATVDVELRFDLARGVFHAQWEGNWYSSDTKDALAEQIKAAATKSLSIDWKRYIRIDYEAEGWPIADERSGRPERQGQYHTFDIDEDRSKLVRGRDADEKFAVCALKLQWSICEISEPYSLPEEPGKRVRARRSVDVWGWDRTSGRRGLASRRSGRTTSCRQARCCGRRSARPCSPGS